MTPLGNLGGPVHVDLNVTDACDLRCSHCHSSSGPRAPSELSATELLAVGREIYDLGVVSLVVAGGEPFVRRGIVDFLSAMSCLPGWSVAVVTNGQWLSRPGAARRLAQVCPDLLVNVSLDGLTPLDNGVLRQKRGLDDGDLFADTCRAIEALVCEGMAVSVNHTITRRSIEDVPRFYEFACERLGADGVVAIKFLPLGYGASAVESLDIPFKLWADHLLEWTDLKESGALGSLRVSVASAWEFYLPHVLAGRRLDEVERLWGYRALPAPQRPGGLGDSAGAAELAVDASGDVFPSVLCVGDARARCGNVRGASLAHIWRTSAILRRLRSSGPADISATCESCGLVNLCGAGSRGRSLGLTGDLLGADVVCPLLNGAPADGPRRLAITPRRGDRSADRPPAAITTHAVFGTGRTAVRLMEFPEGFELRTSWAVRRVDRDDAVALLAYARSSARGDPPATLRQVMDLPRHAARQGATSA